MVINAETEELRRLIDAKSKIDALLEASSGHPELEEIVYTILDGKCDAETTGISPDIRKTRGGDLPKSTDVTSQIRENQNGGSK